MALFRLPITGKNPGIEVCSCKWGSCVLFTNNEKLYTMKIACTYFGAKSCGILLLLQLAPDEIISEAGKR